MSEQHQPDEHFGERPSSAMSQDLRVRLTGGVEDYPHHADGPVQYVVVAYMAGILLAVYASDAEGALGYVVRPELGPDASNSTGFWIDRMRAAWVLKTPPTKALAEMVAVAQRDGLPFQAWVVPGPWQEAPSLAALKEEIVGDGKWDRSPRNLKLNVYPVIPFRGPKMLAPEVTEVMRYVARRQPGKVIFAIDPAYDPHGEVPEERMLGGWEIDENGEIGEFHFNPTYEPTLTALRYRPPENEVERTLQALDSRRGTPEALLDAFREGTLLVSLDEDGKHLRFRQRDDGERILDVYTSTQYVPDDGRQVRAMNGGELAKGLFGCYVAINPGSRANVEIPSADLAVSAFG
ncbi:type VII secretion system-associated protein [Streptomyces sp. LUP47B]|uniref:type VII secretion system-associated protein n=1 Tax=Streptomyces sp. LUP47B TaxID=1890286 RepID=UPI000851722B|nr:type VII secretion system-associated protein [Streptomyces sp. LUP47B]